MNKLAKRLRLTLGALLVDSGEALSPCRSSQCYVKFMDNLLPRAGGGCIDGNGGHFAQDHAHHAQEN